MIIKLHATLGNRFLNKYLTLRDIWSSIHLLAFAKLLCWISALGDFGVIPAAEFMHLIFVLSVVSNRVPQGE